MEYRDTWGNNRYQKAGSPYDLPICSIVLIIINVLLYLAGIFVPGLGYRMDEAGSFSITCLVYEKEYYRLITSAFLHADIEHLLNNMLLLYLCGEIVEKSLGKWRFLVLYMLSAVCGNLLSAAYEFSTGSYYSSIGASGAVFGLTGALLFLVIARRGAAAQISMQRMLISIFLSLYAGFKSAYVNNAAHVGGLLSGFLVAFLLCLLPGKD